MPYLLIALLGVFAVLLIDKWTKNEKEETLSRSKVSNITHTVISEDCKYALIMYNHDPNDEAQLNWALSNAKGIQYIDGHHLYFYNIGSRILSKRIINNTFLKLKEEEYTILNGYPNDKEATYMFIINTEKGKIVFNTFIDQ